MRQIMQIDWFTRHAKVVQSPPSEPQARANEPTGFQHGAPHPRFKLSSQLSSMGRPPPVERRACMQ
ncbi:hypothetical protein GY45DRAFT_1326420 [Cubamyces sp. BRFM 1775]|nr:hypothetical protein GY45DRAFT_1326420 [Cubamyces sp. BRFM 1775]